MTQVKKPVANFRNWLEFFAFQRLCRWGTSHAFEGDYLFVIANKMFNKNT